MADARFDQYARDWLLDSLAQLVQQQGHERLLTAPLLTATPACFPDPWQPDEGGARRMIHRLLKYAGLGRYHLEVETYEVKEKREHLEAPGMSSSYHKQGAAAWFGGIDGDALHFGVEAGGLREPEPLAGTLAHEVAHAFRRHHRLEARSTELEEKLTDLTTVYLGFGILTTNAAYRYRAGGDWGSSHWSFSRVGYLSLDELSFLLAAQAVLRGLDVRAVSRWLERNQAVAFIQAFRELSGSRVELAKQVGVPPEALPDPGQREIAPPRFNAGKEISRVKQTWALPAAIAGAGVGLVLGFVLWGLSPALGLVAFVAPSAVAAAIGRRFRRDRCSHPYCKGLLGPDEQVCDRCGGHVAGFNVLRLIQGEGSQDSRPTSLREPRA